MLVLEEQGLGLRVEEEARLGGVRQGRRALRRTWEPRVGGGSKRTLLLLEDRLWTCR